MEAALESTEKERADDPDQDQNVRVQLGVGEFAFSGTPDDFGTDCDFGQQVDDHVRNANTCTRGEEVRRPAAAKQARLRSNDAAERDHDGGYKCHNESVTAPPPAKNVGQYEMRAQDRKRGVRGPNANPSADATERQYRGSTRGCGVSTRWRDGSR